jgi:MFS family permease
MLRRCYVLFILMIAYACAYLDRSVIGIVLPQLKHEFNFGDAGLGFLSGLAFAAFYVFFGLPAAALADRGNRRNLIVVAIAAWSVMTGLCGLAGNFLQLALARVGVGAGEGGLSPPAQSIISDLFPHQRRATALSVYSVGIYVGILIGLALGGYITEHFGWRQTFFIMAIPGIVVSIVFALTVREPQRGEGEIHTDEGQGHRSFLEVLRFLWVTPALRYTLIGITLCSMFTQTQGAWLPSFLVRSHHMTIGQAGLMLGVTTATGGGLGIVIGGILSDRLGARDPRWRIWVVSAAFMVLPLSALAFLYSGDANVIAAMAFANSFLAAVHLAPTSAVTQNLTPSRMRARAVAVTLFLTSLVGGGFGPLLIGALSDYLQRYAGPDALRFALTSLSAFALAAAASYFVAGFRMPAAGSEVRL